VVLDANPLDDIANALTTWRVIVGGRVFAEPQLISAGEEGGAFGEMHCG
jgi:hypothetical protein